MPHNLSLQDDQIQMCLSLACEQKTVRDSGIWQYSVIEEIEETKPAQCKQIMSSDLFKFLLGKVCVWVKSALNSV